MVDDVPEAHKEAAEEIRAHLVALRGGAPFLSSDDAGLLVQWLEDDIAVPTILRALERAAEAGRKRRRRVPLRLSHAKRHLHKPTRGALAKPPPPGDPHPLAPLAEALEAQAAGGDPRAGALSDLAGRLIALDRSDPEALLRAALGALRSFFLHAWEALSDEERAEHLAAAREVFTDLEAEGATLEAAIEAHARDRLRSHYPLLTAATLWDLVGEAW